MNGAGRGLFVLHIYHRDRDMESSIWAAQQPVLASKEFSHSKKSTVNKQAFYYEHNYEVYRVWK
jgi:hypothetical protein